MPRQEPTSPLNQRINSSGSSPKGERLGDIVQKFRNYFVSMKNQEGDLQLQKTFSHQRELSKQIVDPQERGIFLAIMQDLESELLPNTPHPEQQEVRDSSEGL